MKPIPDNGTLTERRVNAIVDRRIKGATQAIITGQSYGDVISRYK